MAGVNRSFVKDQPCPMLLSDSVERKDLFVSVLVLFFMETNYYYY